MRIDSSGNVGIGGAPAYRLDVDSDTSIMGRFTSSGGASAFIGGDANVVYLGGAAGGANSINIYEDLDLLRFYTGATERMRIDASGNTTVSGGFEAAQPGAGANAFAAGPNAGGSTQGDSAVAIGNLAGSSSQGNDSVAVGNRAGRTTQGSYAVAVGRDAGTTSQGTDSVAVGRLAASLSQGNQSVSVGMYAGYNTQGSSAVAVGSSSGYANQGEKAVAIGRESGAANQGARAVAIGGSAGNSGQSVDAVAIGKAAGETGQGTNSIAIGNSAGKVNQGANGIIINSSGSSNNDTNPNHIVLVSGSGKYLLYNGTDTWKFAGGDVTVPSDSLLVGTTIPISATQTSVKAATNRNCLGLQNTNDSNYLMTAYSTTSEVFRVTGAGNVLNTNNSYGSLSDERLKSDIVDASSQLDDIMAVKVRNYTLDSTGDTHIGVVAQELEASGMGSLVDEGKDGMKSVKYSVLYMKAIKAMQEQQAMIEALKAEVEALKNA
jgi:hypothetical protein